MTNRHNYRDYPQKEEYIPIKDANGDIISYVKKVEPPKIDPVELSHRVCTPPKTEEPGMGM